MKSFAWLFMSQITISRSPTEARRSPPGGDKASPATFEPCSSRAFLLIVRFLQITVFPAAPVAKTICVPLPAQVRAITSSELSYQEKKFAPVVASQTNTCLLAEASSSLCGDHASALTGRL